VGAIGATKIKFMVSGGVVDEPRLRPHVADGHGPDGCVRVPATYPTWAAVKGAVDALLQSRSADGQLTHTYHEGACTWVCAVPSGDGVDAFVFTICGAMAAGGDVVGGVKDGSGVGGAGYQLEVRVVTGDDADLPRVLAALRAAVEGPAGGDGTTTAMAVEDCDVAAKAGAWAGDRGPARAPADAIAVALALATAAPPPPTAHLEYLLVPMLDLLRSPSGQAHLDAARTACELTAHPGAFMLKAASTAGATAAATAAPPSPAAGGRGGDADNALVAAVKRDMIHMGFLDALAEVALHAVEQPTAGAGTGTGTGGGANDGRGWTLLYALEALLSLSTEADAAAFVGACMVGRVGASSSGPQLSQETCTTTESVSTAADGHGLVALLLQLATDGHACAPPSHALHCRALGAALLLRCLAADPAWSLTALRPWPVQAFLTYVGQPAIAGQLSLPARHGADLGQLMREATAAVDDALLADPSYATTAAATSSQVSAFSSQASYDR
jgi:hypothetical protein